MSHRDAKVSHPDAKRSHIDAEMSHCDAKKTLVAASVESMAVDITHNMGSRYRKSPVDRFAICDRKVAFGVAKMRKTPRKTDFEPPHFGLTSIPNSALFIEVAFDAVEQVFDAPFALAQHEYRAVGDPLADLLFGCDRRAVLTHAEVLGDLAVRCRRQLSCEGNREHSRVADRPRTRLRLQRSGGYPQQCTNGQIDVRNGDCPHGVP